MLENNTMIKVTNRDNGSVGYTIPDMNNLHRKFQSGESKEVSMEELRRLSWIPGGQYLLENLLVIENKEAQQELLPSVEPEYDYTREDIEDLLTKGSLEQVQDCLDFAPQGVVNLVKEIAVKTELNDIQKREAILAATGFNVSKAIEINKESANTEETAPAAPTGRRAAPIKITATETSTVEKSGDKVTTGVRRAAPKYNIVGKK